MEIKNRYISDTVEPIETKFCRNMQLPLLTVQKVKICIVVYVQILPKGFEVCANGLIVVKITVANLAIKQQKLM